jgi:hypothetical protein
MYPYKRLAQRAEDFAAANAKYGSSFLDYAIGVQELRLDPTYRGVKNTKLAGTPLGIAIFAPKVAFDGLSSRLTKQKFKNDHEFHFPTVELADDELYRVAVAFSDDASYPTDKIAEQC